MTDHICELAFYSNDTRASVRVFISRTFEQFVHGYSSARIDARGVVIQPGYKRLTVHDKLTYPAWGLGLTQNSVGWATVPREPFGQVPVDVELLPSRGIRLLWPELHRCKPPKAIHRSKGAMDLETASYLVGEIEAGNVTAETLLDMGDEFIAAIKLLRK